MLGLASVRILDLHDGDLQNTDEVREQVVRRIREVRAETVLSVDPTAVFFRNSYYNHSDHRTAGWIALDSAFPGSGNPHFFPEHLGDGLGVQDVTDVWLGWTNEPNHTEDVTGVDPEDRRPREARLPVVRGHRVLRDVPRRGSRGTGKIGVARAEEFRRLDLSE